MLANDNFTMRISQQDKAMLADVAKRFKRSQSDLLKTLVRELWQIMRDEENIRAVENKPPDLIMPVGDTIRIEGETHVTD